MAVEGHWPFVSAVLSAISTNISSLIDANIEMQIEICVTGKGKSIGDFQFEVFMFLGPIVMWQGKSGF